VGVFAADMNLHRVSGTGIQGTKARDFNIISRYSGDKDGSNGNDAVAKVSRVARANLYYYLYFRALFQVTI